jgi:hypothetical protein
VGGDINGGRREIKLSFIHFSKYIFNQKIEKKPVIDEARYCNDVTLDGVTSSIHVHIESWHFTHPLSPRVATRHRAFNPPATTPATTPEIILPLV